jgi:hypothetical protein
MTWEPASLFGSKDHKWREKEAGSGESAGRFGVHAILERLHAELIDFKQDDDHRIAAVEQEVRALRLEMNEIKGALKTQRGGAQPFVDVDVSELVALFDVQDKPELQRRVGSKPKLYAKLDEAARQIATFFDERPRITFEPTAVIVRIRTKLEADEVERLYEQLLDTWWLANIQVEDQMSLAIDFV